MDGRHGLTKDQIAKLASMVDSWEPNAGSVARSEYRDDDPDVILDLRVKHGSGRIVQVRARLGRTWLDKFPATELEPHVHRILGIVADRNLGNETKVHDGSIGDN